ncbi:hypothetical protein [Bradyrhizobium tropiciagri]|uniref:hypothetical protein n=1 Tax=Bradyrhizobium tropiciagri TaxID=312253 RepID=UPI001009D552|nr:hypothetical protein [Bradyrhizobium tropiciagri]
MLKWRASDGGRGFRRGHQLAQLHIKSRSGRQQSKGDRHTRQHPGGHDHDPEGNIAVDHVKPITQSIANASLPACAKHLPGFIAVVPHDCHCRSRCNVVTSAACANPSSPDAAESITQFGYAGGLVPPQHG